MDTPKEQVQDNQTERTFYVPIGANLVRDAGPTDGRGFISFGSFNGCTLGRKRSIPMLDEEVVA